MTHETHGYYSRPLLSHGFTRDDIETKIILKYFATLVSSHIAVDSGAEVLSINRANKTLAFRKEGADKTLTYDKLVLATGSAALIPPPFLPNVGLFNVLNSLDDLIALRKLRKTIQRQDTRPRWAVIGGGLIGCEIAADLATAGDEVVLFHALPRLMERQLVETDSTELLLILRSKLGIDVRLSQAVQGFAGSALNLTVKVAEEAHTGFHGIIVACGFKPRIELAQNSGLTTRRGIAVDGYLTTSDPDIYAIGDCAELPDGKIYAYVTPARNQGLWLARYLAGQTSEPWQVPIFKPKAKVPGFESAYPYLF
jgi:NAD(P)H-nitrite reductase large subunit